MENQVTNSSFLTNKWFFGLIGLVIGLVAAFTISSLTSSNKTPTTPKTTTVKPQIVSLVTAKGIAADGSPVGKGVTFSPTEKSIYAIVTTKNLKKTDRVEYTRYHNGYLVDAKAVSPKNPGDKTISFSWTLSGNKTHKTGTYLIKVYLNGDLAQATEYFVQ